MLGVWAATGAQEALPKGGGRSPPPFGRASRVPGAAQTPKMTEFRNFKIEKHPPRVQPRGNIPMDPLMTGIIRNMNAKGIAVQHALPNKLNAC